MELCKKGCAIFKAKRAYTLLCLAYADLLAVILSSRGVHGLISLSIISVWAIYARSWLKNPLMPKD